MTTARKPRSATAARKTTAGPKTSSEKKTATTKSRSKPAKTTAKKSTATPARAHDALLSGSVIGAVAVKETAMGTNEMEATLQGGTAPATRPANPDALHRMIAEAAYYRAERRGFAPGGEQMDWFQAEAEVRGTERRT